MPDEILSDGTKAPGSWTEVALHVFPAASEAVSEILEDFSGAGVVIEPAIAALGPDEGYLLDDEAPLTVRAYAYGPVSPHRRTALRRRLIRQVGPGQIAGRLSWRTMQAEDWAEAWKAHYDVEHVGRVVIRPAWREYTAKAGEVVVSLDPGMAFGTGQHPTTRMCLQALQNLLSPNDYVLDLGTGSGILALAAVALGAKACIAADTEEQAVAATHGNLALNDASGQVTVVPGSLDAVPAEQPFDLVLANINAAAISALAAGIFALTRSGGAVVGGGIINEREEGCIIALEAVGFQIEKRLADGDWRSLVARKP